MILDILSRYSSPAYLFQYTIRPELKSCIAFSTEAKKFISSVSKNSSITPNSNIISNLAWSKVSSNAFSASTSTSDLLSFASTSTSTSDLSYSNDNSTSTSDLSYSNDNSTSTSDLSYSNDSSTSTSDLSYSNDSSTSTSDLAYSNDNSTSTSDLSYSNDNSTSTSDLSYSNDSSTSTSDLAYPNDNSTSTSDLSYSNDNSTSTSDLSYSNDNSTSTSDLSYSNDSSTSTSDLAYPNDNSTSTSDLSYSNDNSSSTSDLAYSNDNSTSTSDLSCSNDSSTPTFDLYMRIDKCTITSTNFITTFCRDVHISPAAVYPTPMECRYNEVTTAHAPPPAVFSHDTLTPNAATYLTSKKLDNSGNALSKIDGMEESKKQTHCLVCPFTGSSLPEIILQDIIFTKVDTRTEDYKCLGTGITSAVFEGQVVINNCGLKSVAVKLFKQPFDNLEGISAEAGLLKMLESTGITPKLFGILQRTSEGNHPGIVQELIQSSITLHQLIVGKPPFITKQKWYNIAYQLAFGLKSINEQGVLINDLKSDNILVNISTDDCRLTFIDMGHASYMHGKRFPMTTEQASIYRHLAPEIANGQETSESSEVFALGVIFKDIPLEELSFISHKCLSKIPLLRPSVYDILNFVEDIM